MLNIFKYLDYRDLARDAAIKRKKLDSKYKYTDLANTMNIQPPYLSSVFRKSAHLNSDQLFLFCSEFLFQNNEIEYINLLFEYNKTSISSRRSLLLDTIKKIQEENLDTKKYLKAEIVNHNNDLNYHEYYLEPLAPVVHSFLQVLKYQKNPMLIGSVLGIQIHRLNEILKLLEKLEMIKFDTKLEKYIALKPLLHLDKKSPLNNAFQILFRNLGSDQLRRLTKKDKHQYTVTITMDEKTKDSVYEEFNLFIKKVEDLVFKSQSTGIYQINFDLFRWDPKELFFSKSDKVESKLEAPC